MESIIFAVCLSGNQLIVAILKGMGVAVSKYVLFLHTLVCKFESFQVRDAVSNQINSVSNIKMSFSLSAGRIDDGPRLDG